MADLHGQARETFCNISDLDLLHLSLQLYRLSVSSVAAPLPMLTALEQLLNWHPKSTRVWLYYFARSFLSGLSACDCFHCTGCISLIGKMSLGEPVQFVADAINLKLHPVQLGWLISTTCVRSHTFRYAMCMVHDIHRKDSGTAL